MFSIFDTLLRIIPLFHNFSKLFLTVNAPVVISLPHFYEADEDYLRAVEGLSPNGSNHGTFLDVEPVRMLKQYTS